VRAGSIVPFGPEIQYIGEKPEDPLTVYVYAGANGDFILYEDEGTNYNYEHGAFSEIPLHWDDAARTLTLGQRRGSFPGMPEHRRFDVVLVSATHPEGFSFTPAASAHADYNGQAVTVDMK
jgi:alpha-D-xyloside xylohydrolase